MSDSETLRQYAEEVERLRRLVESMANRILAAHEVLANRAERRAVVLTENDYCPLG